MTAFDLPGKTVLMHNRMGIRIELNFDAEGLMELWISPSAGKSLDYRDRNFSCRDDYTRLFDRIGFPGLSAAEFVRCEYDPFHSVVHFKNQVMHALTLFDRPVVVVWFDKVQDADFKCANMDRLLARTAKTFAVEHADRGKKFHFVAALGKGKGKGASVCTEKFRHQPVIEKHRSVYARAELSPGQVLAIAGELADMPVAAHARAAARMSATQLAARTEKLVSAAVLPGSFELRKTPELQKLQRLLDVNRRVLAAMQDASGAIRAAISRIYYLIWVRDGSMIECFNAYAGSSEPLKKWARFMLANPTEVRDEEPKGRTFVMLVNRNINKWEEDGIFYAIWAAFTAWTQTGDRSFVTGSSRKVLDDAMDWLERYCLVKSRGLFGRFYHCETPLPGSRDDMWDSAVGKPVDSYECLAEGKSIRQSFDIYINLYAYASYVMLSAMHEGRQAQQYLRKAEALAEKMDRFFATDRPMYGELKAADGSILPSGPYGLDRSDYLWGLCVPPFLPRPWRMPAIQKNLLGDCMAKTDHLFLSALFSVLQALDVETFSEKELLQAVQYAAAQCYPPGGCMAMPNTIVELLDVKEPQDEIRPQAFSTGPWLATIVGLGLRRLPFGLAVRANESLVRIRQYEYQRSRIDVEFSGKGALSSVTVNGRALEGSLQIPERLLKPGKNRVAVKMGGKAARAATLVSSSVRLSAIAKKSGRFVYAIEAFGANTLEFRDLAGREVTIADARGRTVPHETHEANGHTYIQFPGRGEFTVTV